MQSLLAIVKLPKGVLSESALRSALNILRLHLELAVTLGEVLLRPG